MAIKVLIKRQCPKDKERELFSCIKDIRRQVPLQPGYISSEYLKSIGESSEITAISSWYTLKTGKPGLKVKNAKIYKPGLTRFRVSPPNTPFIDI